MNKREYAIEHRRFLFRDEWLAYVALTSLYALYEHADWPIWPFITAAIWAFICITTSYVRQWRIESTIDEVCLAEEHVRSGQL